MQLSTIRKVVLGVAALLVLALLLLAALPLIASTQIVRNRITQELSLWSGYRVSLGEAPAIEVWPTFKATLSDVAFHEWAGEDKQAVLEADRLDASLSALAALRGEVVMSAISLQRPLLRLRRSGDRLELPASPGGGRMMRAVRAANNLVKENPSSADRNALPEDSFGSVEFVDGRITIQGDDEDEAVTALNGRLNWPALNRGARLSATGIWRGENVSLELETPSPLLLVAGSNTQLNAKVKSALLEGSFEGTVNLAADTYLDGKASFSSASLRRTLEWLRVKNAPAAAVGAMSIASTVKGDASRLRLENASLTLGTTTGRGVLDLSFIDRRPAVAGTLAFDKLDLRSSLAAFMPIASGSGDIYDEIDTSFTQQLSLDLRLSAPTATLGRLPLTEVAASAQVKPGLAAFDISDATAFDGTIQAGLRVDGTGDTKVVEMRVMADEIDPLALAKATGAERLQLQGRADISATVRGTGVDWNSVMGSTEGTFTASVGAGALVGMDLAKFRERWSQGGFFPLSEVAGGSLPIRGLDFKARINGGVARIEKGDLLLDGRVLSLSGIIPYFGRALALSGHLVPMGSDGERGEAELPFFIGGAWDTPFVAPAQPPARDDVE